MKETAVKSVNYLPGAQCLPSYHCLPSRQAEQEKQHPASPGAFVGLNRRIASAPGEMAPKAEHRHVDSAPREMVLKKEGESSECTSKIFGEPPFCNIKVSNKPSDKNVRIVRFVALKNSKGLPEDTAQQLTEFLSELLDPSEWPFEFVYDLRALPVPKLHMVIHLAKWGSNADRQKYFIKRCVGCRIILSPGMMFNITKASCLAFFKVCPPTCNTYLMTDDSEPGPDTHFFPPPKAIVDMRKREAANLEKLNNPQSPEEAASKERTLSGANPQDPEAPEDAVVDQPAGCLSWFTGSVHKTRAPCVEPPECFSFLAVFKQPTKPNKESVDQMAKLNQTIVDQQKAIEVLTKRIQALEGADTCRNASK